MRPVRNGCLWSKNRMTASSAAGRDRFLAEPRRFRDVDLHDRELVTVFRGQFAHDRQDLLAGDTEVRIDIDEDRSIVPPGSTFSSSSPSPTSSDGFRGTVCVH